ncbi:MAG: Lrp/AsnC family transcriptional regulator, partial [Planctomycetes bacterium]|nr:Lrp/AsnC family transcriptional regulator [Planctomycetota bacterium]
MSNEYPVIEIDQLDLTLIRELQINGRLPISEIANRVGTSKSSVQRRLKVLLTKRVIKVVAIIGPTIRRYRTAAMIGVIATPSEVSNVASRLASYANVQSIVIATGRYNIVIWTMFHSPAGLSNFLRTEIGTDPGVVVCETMMNLETKKLSFAYLAAGNPVHEVQRHGMQESNLYHPLDQRDISIIQELEVNGRARTTDIAKKLGISRNTARDRIQSLVEREIIKIVALGYPPMLGYPTMAYIGINAVSAEINNLADRLAFVSQVHGVIVSTGRYDIIVWAIFRTTDDLADFLIDELGKLPGVVRTEAILNLKITKL